VNPLYASSLKTVGSSASLFGSMHPTYISIRQRISWEAMSAVVTLAILALAVTAGIMTYLFYVAPRPRDRKH